MLLLPKDKTFTGQQSDSKNLQNRQMQIFSCFVYLLKTLKWLFDSDSLLWFLKTPNFGGVGEKSIQDSGDPWILQKHMAIPWRE